MIKKGILSILYVLIIKGCLFTQITFNNTIDFSQGLEQVYGVCPVNEGYILLGSGYGNEVGDFFDIKMKFAKVGLEGNLIWQKVYGAPDTNYFIYPKNGIVTIDGNVVVCGSRQTASESKIHLIKINSITGDTLFYKVFNFDDEIYGLQVQELSDGSLIILGYDSNDSFAFLFIKTTSEGQYIWDKRFGSTSEGYPTDFNIVEDTIYVVNGNYLCSPVGYRIRSIDSNGDIISTVLYDDDCVAYGLKSSFDGFIGAGAYYPVPPYQTFAYKTDANGNMLWHFETSIDIDTLDYEQLFPDMVKELPNGDIVVAGYYSSNYLGSYIALISKINSDGTAYWERQYTSTADKSDDNIPYDIELCDDGGYILVGSAFGAEEVEGQNFWALKLDSVGCLIPGCDTLDDQIMETGSNKNNIHIFPNPVTNQSFCAAFIQNLNDYGNLHFKIIDLTGKEILEKRIDFSTYESDGTLRFPIGNLNIADGVFIIEILDGPLCVAYSKFVYISK